jgi:hypothetical protein
VAEDWVCHVCQTPVSWGTAVCPLCGSALSWEEEDEEEPLAALMPPTWEDDYGTARQRRVRWYTLTAIGAGLLMGTFGVATGALWWLFVGVLFVAAGVYGLVALPKRYQ